MYLTDLTVFHNYTLTSIHTYTTDFFIAVTIE